MSRVAEDLSQVRRKIKRNFGSIEVEEPVKKFAKMYKLKFFFNLTNCSSLL